MSNFLLETPIVFLIFKRPDTTQKVFDVIRKVKPKNIFVVADGPRADREGEGDDCAKTRSIIDQIDWDCEIHKNYSDINLGCAKRVSTGLDWVFSQVEEAIILEDDCIPDLTFFPFCEELLGRYRYDNRVASISGQNVQFGRRRTDYSYYFSRYNHCWGWATWRRAWQHFDFDMKVWPNLRDHAYLYDVLNDTKAVEYWADRYQKLYEGTSREDSWAHRWTLACWSQSSLGIISKNNLVSNIGFDHNATHYMGKRSRYNNMPAEPLDFPLQHPPFLIRDLQADTFTQKTLFTISPYRKFKSAIKKAIVTPFSR